MIDPKDQQFAQALNMQQQPDQTNGIPMEETIPTASPIPMAQPKIMSTAPIGSTEVKSRYPWARRGFRQS